MADTLEDTRATTAPVDTNGTGDHDKFSHYVDKTKQVDALVGGTALSALCGKVWVPTEIDNTAEKRPVCPDCKRIYDELAD